MPPEILAALTSNNNFDEKKADIFSFGVTLFSAVLLSAPFESGKASENDALYKHFYTKNYDEFWNNTEIASKLEYMERRGLKAD